MNRLIEVYIIYLKEDLKLSGACKTIKDGLLKSINDQTYFSDDLAAYFTRDNPNVPFAVSPTDPTQVAALKKILNALENTEKSFKAIESINISRDRYKIGFAKDAVQVTYNAVHEIYAALKLLNESSVDIQNIAGPHLQKLLPQIGLATKALGKLGSDNPEEAAGIMLAGAVNMLPTDEGTEDKSLGNVSQIIYQLPHYFEELQKLIATGASGITAKSVTSARDYQAAMLANANAMQQNFDALSKGAGLFPYLSMLNKLRAHSMDLLNAAAPLTKQAYLDAEDKLQDIKHNILPKLIAELETVEESMGLKPGVLTGPALEQMDAYYTQLANQVSKIADAAGVIHSAVHTVDSWRILVGGSASLAQHPGEELSPDPNLNVLMDDKFNEQRRARQANRLNEARFNAADTSQAEAAERFFTKINSYSTWINRSLAAVSEGDKKELIADYKKFQSHFAALHPDIDQLIVDTLTKPSQGLASRLYNTGISELWSSNHFTTITQCKTGVLNHISQNVAQAKFREKLVEKTMSHAENAPSALYMKKEEQRVRDIRLAEAKTGTEPEKPKPFKTYLNESIQPFQPLPFKLEDNKSADHYHAKGIAVESQMTQLERAQSGVKDFFDYLSSEFPHVNPTFASLNETQKEKLRAAYKKFQPQLMAMGPTYEAINTQLVSSLNSDKGTLVLRELALLKTAISDNIKQSITDLKQDRAAYFTKENEVRQQEFTSTPLTAKGAELGQKTLFGHLSTLKLSKPIDDFFNDKFQKYLKDNLSPTVWQELSTDGETIDVSKLPFTEFHKDTPEVVMYKNLINAIHHTKNGLKQLESLNDLGDPNNLATRGRYVYKVFDALVKNIIASQYYIAQAAGNPALKEIMKEGLDLLAPLKDLPLIGDYVKPSEKQKIPKQDLIEAWRQQQQLVEETLRSTSPKAVPKTDQQIISEKLNDIINEIDRNPAISAEAKEQIKAQFNALNKNISGLSFGPNSARKILTTLDNFENQLSSIITKSAESDKSAIPELIRGLEQTHAALNTQLKEAAEYTEFYSGQSIGTYSSVINNKVDDFYKNLMKHLSSIEGLKAVLPTEEKVSATKEDSDIPEKKQSDAARMKAIFGAHHAEFNKLYQPYMLMRRIVNDSRSVDFEQLKSEVGKYYQIIQPELVKINPAFDKHYISNCDEPLSLFTKIDAIFAERHHINPPSSPFDRLKDLYLDGNFAKVENQAKFRTYYGKIQPYLQEIDSSYNATDFLSKLTTPEHFAVALQKIINTENSLTKPLTDASYLQLIAENLYQIPVTLNKHKGEPTAPSQEKKERDQANEKMKAFIEGLSGLSFGPKSIQKLLNTSSRLQIQLAQIGKLGRDLTMSHLKEIQSEFGTILMEAADSAEFNLGLKPGTYSKVVSDKFDKFYSSLITNLPIKKAETELALLIDATSTQKRLAREQERLATVRKDSTAADTQKSIFGFAPTTPLYQPYIALQKLAKDIEAGILQEQYGPNLEELKSDANSAYQKIQPYLVKINPIFMADYISKCTDESALVSAVDKLFAERDKIHNHSSAFDKIMDLYINTDFSNEKDKIKFIQCFDELQPFLAKINYLYGDNYTMYFVRELQTPEDFKNAAAKILNEEIQLRELIDGLSHTKDLKIKLCEERVGYFSALLEKQEKTIGPQKIAAYKEHVFSNYIHGEVESLLAADFGQENAELYLQVILPLIEEKKVEILKDITLQDDIAGKIAEEVIKILPAIKEQTKEAFKEQIFKSYIDKNIKDSLQSDLGIYTNSFLKKITSAFEAHKADILAGVAVDKEIGKNIHAKMNLLATEVLQNHTELKRAYSELNKTAVEIDTLIAEEKKKPEGNPCRTEKIALLESLKENLSTPKGDTIEALANLNKESQKALKSLDHYDALISIQDVLASLKKTMQGDPAKIEQLETITELQIMIKDSRIAASERLESSIRVLSATSPLFSATGNLLLGEAFKGQLYVNYVNTTLKAKLQEELGEPYGKVFFEHIKDDLIAKKSEVIKDLSFEHIDLLIAPKVEMVTQDIYKTPVKPEHKELKKICAELNESLNKINQLIADVTLEIETEKAGLLLENPRFSEKELNQCRIEKLSKLQSYRDELLDTQNIPDLKRRNDNAKAFIKNLVQYDQMIKINEQLMTMGKFVQKDSATSVSMKGEKTAEIEKMQGMLTNNPSKNVSQRLQELKEYGSSDECEDKLLKNSSTIFAPIIHFFQKLLAKIGITNERENLVYDFKQQLTELRNPPEVIEQDEAATPKHSNT